MRVTSTTGDASIRLLKTHTTLRADFDVTLAKGELSLTQLGFNEYFPQSIDKLIEILYVPDGGTWAVILSFPGVAMRMSGADYDKIYPLIRVTVLTSTVTHPIGVAHIESWPGMSARRSAQSVTTLPAECDKSLLLASTPATGAMYGTTGTGVTAVTYVLSAQTAIALAAKVIRKSGGTAPTVSVFDASRTSATGAPSLEWKVSGVSTAGTNVAKDAGATDQPVAAGCADLRACLAKTPLDLAACAVAAGSASCAAAATKSLAAAGSRLDHEGTKVDLYTLERALFGSDTRGVFVVLPEASTAKTQSGKMLFVAAGATKGALFDVLFDETTKVWRAKKPNWVLIVGLIGGGVVLLVILIISLAYAFRAPHPYTMMM